MVDLYCNSVRWACYSLNQCGVQPLYHWLIGSGNTHGASNWTIDPHYLCRQY